ncbi:hypothetical protein M0Q97_10550 [Candidatus Dojkabacteria bacterium]|jgi:hypothetical protein|nr:hypothetical protein [Candidatus Dojkabacteria bacterium]
MKLLEDVGDKYAERAFGIKTKFSDFEQIYNQSLNLIKQKEKPIAQILSSANEKTYIFKNPKSLKDFDNEVRAIGDINGDLYVCLDNVNIVHGMMSKALFGRDTYDETDKYVFLHRVKKTNIFGLSDSTEFFIDANIRAQTEYLQNAKIVKTIIDNIKRKNPQYKILDIYYEFIRGSMLDDDKYKKFL